MSRIVVRGAMILTRLGGWVVWHLRSCLGVIIVVGIDVRCTGCGNGGKRGVLWNLSGIEPSKGLLHQDFHQGWNQPKDERVILPS